MRSRVRERIEKVEVEEDAYPTAFPPVAVFRLVKSETVPLTRELAQQFYEMPGSPTEREIKKSRLAMLETKRAAKQLIPFTWATCKLGDQVYRVNGQHSSAMLVACNGEDFPEGLTVHRDYYETESKAGLAELFRQFDNTQSGRTPEDTSGAFQGIIDRLINAPRDVVKKGIEAVGWYMNHVDGIKPPRGTNIYNLLNDEAYHDFLLWLPEIIGTKSPEMSNQGVIAALYGTWLKNEEAAREFWHQVMRGGVDYDDEAPATILDNWLKTIHEMTTEQRVRAGYYGFKAWNYYVGCIYAWNAFRRERKIVSINCKPKATPEVAD